MNRDIEELADLIENMKKDKARLEDVIAQDKTLLHGVFVMSKDGALEKFSDNVRTLTAELVLKQLMGVLAEFEARLQELKKAPVAEVIPFKIKDNVEDAVIVEEPKNE